MSLSVTLLFRGIARGVHVAASLSVFGAITGHAILVPRSRASGDTRSDRTIAPAMVRLVCVSLVVAVAAGIVWLLAEAAYIAGSHRLGAGLALLGPVLGETNFGRLLIARLALLTLAAILFGDGQRRGRAWVATVPVAIATMLQAGLGHGAAMGGVEGIALAIALALHVTAAGLWLGGLAPLLMVVTTAPPSEAHWAARRFSVLGAVCVTVLVITAGVQGGLLIGSVRAFVNTDYGRVAAGKLILFLVLLVIAARNCFRLTSGLVSPSGARSRTGLRRAIIGEAVIGSAVILLAGVLMELPPGMTMGGMPH